MTKLRVAPSKKAQSVAKGPKREVLSRTGIVSGWGLEVWAHGADGRFFEKRAGGLRLIARGEFTESVNGVADFELMLTGGDARNLKEAHAVGVFLRAKPMLDGVVYLAWEELGTLVPIATLNRPLQISMSFQKPRYGSGEIHSLALSTSLDSA